MTKTISTQLCRHLICSPIWLSEPKCSSEWSGFTNTPSNVIFDYFRRALTRHGTVLRTRISISVCQHWPIALRINYFPAQQHKRHHCITHNKSCLVHSISANKLVHYLLAFFMNISTHQTQWVLSQPHHRCHLLGCRVADAIVYGERFGVWICAAECSRQKFRRINARCVCVTACQWTGAQVLPDASTFESAKMTHVWAERCGASPLAVALIMYEAADEL